MEFEQVTLEHLKNMDRRADDMARFFEEHVRRDDIFQARINDSLARIETILDERGLTIERRLGTVERQLEIRTWITAILLVVSYIAATIGIPGLMHH